MIMRNFLILIFCLVFIASCGKNHPDEKGLKLTSGSLLNDTLWEGDNWTSERRSFQLDLMFHGRVASVSRAFEECVEESVLRGTPGNGPYYYCKGDPYKELNKVEQAKKALRVSRTFHNVKVKYEPNGSGNAHHHGGGGYNDPNEYFHWAGWFNSAAEALNYKICADDPFCVSNPGHENCSSRYNREDNTPGQRRCRYSAYPWPYSQAAGIAWHEVMHHHDYAHGSNSQTDAPDKCGTQNVRGWHYQRNTMPYIVGNCIDRVLSLSQSRCGNIKAGAGKLRLIKGFNENDCELVEDPKRVGVQFVAQHSGKCVDVYWNNLNNGANINQWNCNASGAGHFTLRPHSSGYYQIENRTSGKCLDVEKSSRTNGANIIQYECNQTTNQIWKLKDVGSGHYSLEAMHSGKCLDIVRSSKDDGANIVQWDCNNTTNQRFQIRGLYHSKDFGSDLGERFFQVSRSSFTGIAGKAGALLDSLSFLSSGVASEVYGGSGGSPFSYNCPRGTSVVGIFGRAGARIDSLGVVCSDVNRTQKYRSAAFGGMGGNAFSFTCHKGFRVKKIQGLADRLINRITVFCGI